jgi:hypothetical protein
MTCDRCGLALVVGDWPFCPHGRAASSVQGDEIDVVIENNGTSQPIRFRSRDALRRHLDAHNLAPMVRHVPLPGSDRSPHTVDWSRGIDPQTLANATALLSRPASGSQGIEDVVLPVEVTVRTLDTGFVVRMERD